MWRQRLPNETIHSLLYGAKAESIDFNLHVLLEAQIQSEELNE